MNLCCTCAEAYDSLDPNGNITIKWDILQWTADGYVVSMKHHEIVKNCFSQIFIDYKSHNIQTTKYLLIFARKRGNK